MIPKGFTHESGCVATITGSAGAFGAGSTVAIVAGEGQPVADNLIRIL